MFARGWLCRFAFACFVFFPACTSDGSQELVAQGDASRNPTARRDATDEPRPDAALADVAQVDGTNDDSRSGAPVDAGERAPIGEESRSTERAGQDSGDSEASIEDASLEGSHMVLVEGSIASLSADSSVDLDAIGPLFDGAAALMDGEAARPDGHADVGADRSAAADADAPAARDAVADAVAEPPPEAADAMSEARAAGPATGGYQVRAAALRDGHLAIAHAVANVDFYARARDTAFGGFFTFLDQAGRFTSTNKSFGVQSRDAYAFVRAFMLTGNEAYLDDGRFALDFLYGHGWDEARDGFYFIGDRSGNPLARPVDVPSDKSSYAQNYALVGITAMCEATRSAKDCAWMDRALLALDTHYRDTLRGGYFEQASLDFRIMSGKGINPTVDAITTHALHAYLINRRAGDRARLLSLAGDALDHLVANMGAPGVAFGFPVSYLSDWTIDRTNRGGFVGHLFKTSWALARAYLVDPDVRYREAARKVLRQMYDGGGFDRVNGAPNSTFDWASGVTSTNKEYWQLEQAFTSGLLNWYVARNDEDRAAFLEMADRSLDFFMTHLPDRDAGAIFFATNSDGTAILRRDKGDQWEGSYHDVELAYETYLYGNLLFWRRPATLFYRFDAAAQDRAIALTPLAIEDDQLLITAVSHAGQAYGAFDGPSRSLRIPAGTSGVFAVTFAHTP